MTRLSVVIALALLSGVTLSAQQPAHNYYAGGNRIDITAPVEGDAVVAGRIVNIEEEVGGDVLAAGWRVSLAHRVLDDVRIVAAEVIVNAPVDGDLTAAGGDVTVGKNAHVTGRVWLTGGTVRVDGVLDREVQIAGGTVQIGGEIRQPLRVTAERLEVLANAHLLNTVTYSGPAEAIVSDQAQVTGPIAFHRIPAADARRARWTSAMSSALFAVNLIVAGLLLLLLLPRFASATVTTLQTDPVRSLFFGFGVLVAIPIAAVVLIATVIGAPVGLTLGVMYVVGLLLGVLTTASYLGQVEARWMKIKPLSTFSQNAVALMAGALTLAVLRTLLGGVVVFVAVLFGLGALALVIYRSRPQLGSYPL